jgi:hypothetical protein
MKHSSYLEYFLDMKNTFISGYSNAQLEKEIDKDLEKIFLDFLMESIKNTWILFESNERDTYLLYEDELEEIWKKSTDELIGCILLNLSNKEYIKTSVNSNGELVYSVSEKGAEYLRETNL